uniref:Protein hunchback n=1 Tax=Echinostoma caproni TaxID=27848 RepID=A0A183AB02_9TREM
LEYHMRNHMGSKPYKCPKCNYECVNKSMLNSHMKSHSNVYPYRCANCHYATKYCHSLKLHLAKHDHKPAVVLNADGSLEEDDVDPAPRICFNRHAVESADNQVHADEALGSFDYECRFCEIRFRQRALYDIHMGFHSHTDPYLCNRCGHQSGNPVDFFIHLGQMAHHA